MVSSVVLLGLFYQLAQTHNIHVFNMTVWRSLQTLSPKWQHIVHYSFPGTFPNAHQQKHVIGNLLSVFIDLFFSRSFLFCPNFLFNLRFPTKHAAETTLRAAWCIWVRPCSKYKTDDHQRHAARSTRHGRGIIGIIKWGASAVYESHHFVLQ